MNRTFLYLCLSSVFVYAEPSVYANAGSTNTANTKAIASLKRKIVQQKERMDGLMSIVEGLSATVNNLQNKPQASADTQGNKNTNKLLEDLGMMIDEINEKYVSKEELKKMLDLKGKTVPEKIAKKPKEKTSKKPFKAEESLKEKSTAILYSEGVRLFVKKRYDEAKKRFSTTDIKGYKPAASNYYLGEISYYSKEYEDAIFYFKKSAGLYDKASYIDTLLLHTAISLEKNGEKTQAKAFYENIIENYEGKKTAHIAKEKLKKL